MEKKIEIEEWLMHRIAQGDRDAFANLVDRNQDMVLRIAYRFLGKQEDAEDAAQEVFVKLFVHSRHYKSQGIFRSFLSRMTVNECLNRLRKIGRLSAVPFEEDVYMAEDSTPEEVYEKEERKEKLQNALEKLPERQRLAFLMKVDADLSYQEIGNLLGCSRTAVEGLIFRARQHLQEQLSPIVKETENSHVV